MVDQSKAAETFIHDCFQRLGIASLSDWDVLIFIYRHKTNLASADQIARLLGYSSKAVGSALDRLESKNLILRSRCSQGVRLYQCTPFEAAIETESCLGKLIGLSEDRSGRLLLIRFFGEHAVLQMAARGKSR
jgi:hypothetical protein